MHDLFRRRPELSTLRGSWVISCGLFSPAMTKLISKVWIYTRGIHERS